MYRTWSVCCFCKRLQFILKRIFIYCFLHIERMKVLQVPGCLFLQCSLEKSLLFLCYCILAMPFYLLKYTMTGCCLVNFLVCTSHFVVMFVSGNTNSSGSCKRSCNAYISQSTRVLRSLLKEQVRLTFT